MTLSIARIMAVSDENPLDPLKLKPETELAHALCGLTLKRIGLRSVKLGESV